MSARDRILGAVGRLVLRASSDLEVKDAATHRASSGRDYVFGGQPLTSNWDIDRAVRDGYEKVIWVFKAIDAIAEKVSGWTLEVIDETDPENPKVIDDPITPLLNARANLVDGPAKNFRYRLSSQLLLSKQGVFLEVIPSKGGGIAALNLLPPGRTRPIPDPDTFVRGFEVTLANGDRITLLPYDERTRKGVLWIRKPHPTDPYSSVTPLEPAGISIDLDQYQRLYNLHFLRNDGRAGQLVAVKGGMSQDDADELKRRFSGGIGSVGRTTVIEADSISVQDTAVSPRDAQYAELRSITKEDLLIALGTPESVLGNASGRTFDNADAERESWLRDTVLAHARVIEGALEVLTAGGWDDDRRLRHNTSKEWVLNREKRADEAKAAADFTAGLITAAEYRKLTGHDELDSPAARVLWIAGGKVAVGSEEDQKAASELKPVGGGAAASAAAAPAAAPGADPAALAAASRGGAIAGAARGQELAATARRDTNTQDPGQPGVRKLVAVKALPEDACVCCKGIGEHATGRECYRCDASGREDAADGAAVPCDGTYPVNDVTHGQKALPARQKCKFCSEEAAARVIHSEGMAYVPACKAHLGKAKDAAARCTPDGSVYPGNIDAIRGMDGRKYEEEEKTLPSDLPSRVCPACGERVYLDPTDGWIAVDGTTGHGHSAAILAATIYPLHYPYPRVFGAPPAIALLHPTYYDIDDLQSGDVINVEQLDEDVTVVTTSSSPEPVLLVQHRDGTVTAIPYLPGQQMLALARTRMRGTMPAVQVPTFTNPPTPTRTLTKTILVADEFETTTVDDSEWVGL